MINGSDGIPKDLEAWSYANWKKVPDLVRQDCIGHLKSRVPPELLELWKSQHKAGQKIGSDDLYFHHGTGMAVRNTLRDQLLDEELPPIKQTHIVGHPEAQNWDDFYMGALQEFVEQELANGVVL